MVATLSVYIGLAALAFCYWLILPRSIPGIPCNRWARWLPIGDMLTLGRYNAKHGESIVWFTEQCWELGSPIIQVFLGRKPLVVLTDMQEMEDIAVSLVITIARDAID